MMSATTNAWLDAPQIISFSFIACIPVELMSSLRHLIPRRAGESHHAGSAWRRRQFDDALFYRHLSEKPARSRFALGRRPWGEGIVLGQAALFPVACGYHPEVSANSPVSRVHGRGTGAWLSGACQSGTVGDEYRTDRSRVSGPDR